MAESLSNLHIFSEKEKYHLNLFCDATINMILKPSKDIYFKNGNYLRVQISPMTIDTKQY